MQKYSEVPDAIELGMIKVNLNYLIISYRAHNGYIPATDGAFGDYGKLEGFCEPQRAHLEVYGKSQEDGVEKF